MLLAPAATALAQDPPPPSYPEPKDPGKVVPEADRQGQDAHGLQAGACKFRTIQKAVNKAKKGDTVKVKNGKYKEAVQIKGAKKSYITLLGNPKKPGKVVLEGKGGKQNGVFVDGADEVTVRGFKAQNYGANGFFFVNVVGYTARDLIAAKTGVYGVYAFNSKGGTMRDSEAYYNNDAGFYIGQTPAQEKPIRSIVTNIKSWGNPLGWSGTNMRYVTITKSFFYNNAAGIVPNALDSEKFPPAEDNVIADNDIFWNNFNFHKGAPFEVREEGTAALVRSAPASCCSAAGATPSRTTASTATGGRRRGRRGPSCSRTTRRRATSIGNEVVGNQFGLGRHRPQRARARLRRQRHGNCFGGNAGRLGDDPGRRVDARRLPVRRAERVQRGPRRPRCSASRARRRVAKQIRHPHAPKKGFEPLEIYTP